MMEWTLSANELHQALNRVVGVVERRQTLPILSYVLLTISGSELTLTGTDLEVEISSKIKLTQPGADCTLTLPARKITDICKLLADDAKLTFVQQGDHLQVKVGNSRYTLNSLPSADFPIGSVSSEVTRTQMNATDLAAVLAKTHFAIATNDVRYYLTGLLLEFNKKQLTAVATDGHRLALARLEQAQEVPAQQLIVPRKAISELMRLLREEPQEIQLEFSGQHLRVQADQFILTTKLIESQFPPYAQVIPRHGDKQITLSKEALKAIIHRVAIVSQDTHKGVHFTLSRDRLVVFAENVEHERAEEELSIDYPKTDIQILMNANYLLDVLQVLPEGEVTFTLSDAQTGILIESAKQSEAVYVIMPMQV